MRRMSEAAAQGGSHSGVGVAWRVLPDERLARRACKGDQRAFAAIFRRYHQGLYRYCLAIVGNGADAQDALQNAMVKVLRALPGETRPIQLKPWLYRIAHNESVELLRRRRSGEPLDPELTVSAGSPEAVVELRERLRRLVADLGELPERQRGALVMRELADLGFAEIGVAFGTSAGVARQTIYEARQGLRQIATGREMSCVTVTEILSDADGRTLRRRDIRAHLRSCAECRAFGAEIGERRAELAALAPLPAIAASGLLQGLLGGQAASTGGGLAGAIGAGAGKAIGAAALSKTAASVALVAVAGIAAGDRAGAIHLVASSSAPHPRSTETVVPARPDRGASPPAKQGREPSAALRKSGPQAVTHPGQPNPQPAKPLDAGTQPGEAPGESAEPEAPGKSGGGANSRGPAEGLPAAAAHGQETAAINRGRGQNASHAEGKGNSGAGKAASNAKDAPPGRSAQKGNPGHEPQAPTESPPKKSEPPEPEPKPAPQKAEAPGKGK